MESQCAGLSPQNIHFFEEMRTHPDPFTAHEEPRLALPAAITCSRERRTVHARQPRAAEQPS